MDADGLDASGELDTFDEVFFSDDELVGELDDDDDVKQAICSDTIEITSDNNDKTISGTRNRNIHRHNNMIIDTRILIHHSVNIMYETGVELKSWEYMLECRELYGEECTCARKH